MYVVTCGGILGSYDDETLKALVAVAKKHGIKLILSKTNYGGGMFTKLVNPVQQHSYEPGVEDAEWSII